MLFGFGRPFGLRLREGKKIKKKHNCTFPRTTTEERERTVDGPREREREQQQKKKKRQRQF